MRSIFFRRILAMACWVALSATLLAAEPVKSPAGPALLPPSFAGWVRSSWQTGTDPSAADSAHAGLLREYGFTDCEQASYRRDNREMTVKAARFADASGAYGAFTFYKLPQMLNEKIGDQGASWNEKVLFYRGNVLLEANLDRITAMSAADLRALSDAVPLPGGPARNLPTLPQYLPKQNYVKNSAKYVLGPIGLASVGAPITAEQVQFERGAEVAEGKYSTARGAATLLLISYPTPQIAGDRQRSFSALNPSDANSDASLAPPFVVKRTGPIVALAAGQISPDEANSLLAAINYDANVTWNQNTFFDRKNNVANLLVNIIFLIAIIFGFALVAGLAFGGARLLAKRVYPEKSSSGWNASRSSSLS